MAPTTKLATVQKECKLTSVSSPPSQRVADSTKMTDTNSQSDSITVCLKCLSPTSSAEGIKVESVTDSSDYTSVDPVSHLNRWDDIEKRTERTTVYLLCREQKDILANMKVEEEDGERQSVEMERDHVVKDEEGFWKGEEKERDGHGEGRVTNQVAQNLLKNGVKSEHGQQKGELSNLVISCLLKQPRVLIHRLEIANISVSGSSPLRSMACKRDQRAASPWRPHELSPLRGNGSLRQKGQVVTWKRKTVGQLERPLKLLPSSSENGICAETSLISPVISPKNHQNTGQTVEVLSQVFACSQCPFVHTDKVNLQWHVEKVHPDQISRTMGSQQPPNSTHQHPTKTPPTLTQSHTGTLRAHTWSQYGKSLKCKSQLRTDKKMPKEERAYQCTQCEKSFAWANKLKVHQRTHTGERPYHCSLCGRSFAQSSTLKQHQRTHTGEVPYQCSLCGKGFAQSSTLKQHQSTHTREHPYHCSQCEKSFAWANKLKVHQRTHTGERPYHCSLCARGFAQSSTLKQHQRTHTGELPYHCSLCGKGFAQSSTLKQHQSTHTGEHLYHCSQCGKSFAWANKLKVHQRTHTGERPYHCSLCGRGFAQSSTLKKHQRTHTGELPYECSQCGKGFAQSGNLKKHQQTHTEKDPYHCAQCGKSFTRLSSLKIHQQTHIQWCAKMWAPRVKKPCTINI
ncbi:zinc finger protein ZFP2-like isoform X2 [Conger conger]|uniref:zinc finger protein ZFP2-like isoform X2 n=1 Tax=Conger conger TaxID=82655 RepID=UPI002A59EC9B|nr:zinc finger protein ZFP2-like isoform X2 [Conger conger]